MISFHSLLFLLLWMMRKKKKIDSHHADHNNNKKKKNTSDAMTSINQHEQDEEEERHTPVPCMPFQCVHVLNSLIDLHDLLLFLQRRHNSFQTQASLFLVHFHEFLVFSRVATNPPEYTSAPQKDPLDHQPAACHRRSCPASFSVDHKKNKRESI